MKQLFDAGFTYPHYILWEYLAHYGKHKSAKMIKRLLKIKHT
jgi:hypothetical protein